MKKFINSIFYFWLAYFKTGNDLPFYIFSANVVLCVFLIAFIAPIIYYVDYILNFKIIETILSINKWVASAMICLPIYLIVSVLTSNAKNIDELTEESFVQLRDKGKKNNLVVLSIIISMWLVRLIFH